MSHTIQLRDPVFDDLSQSGMICPDEYGVSGPVLSAEPCSNRRTNAISFGVGFMSPELSTTIERRSALQFPLSTSPFLDILCDGC